jgi:predicted ATP-binding protein involved in virulence
MRIDKITLQNFRCFEQLEVDFLPNFNVIIGNNGTGKSSLMEAISMSVSGFFLGIDDASQRKFLNNDMRYINFHNKPEYQFPLNVSSWGEVNHQKISWAVSKQSKGDKTRYEDSVQIKAIGRDLQSKVRNGEEVELPIIAYFGANRLWGNVEKDNEQEEKNLIETELKSRLDTYKNALRPVAHYEFVKQWFKNKELAAMQVKIRENRDLPDVLVVKKAVSNCIENCKDVYYSLEIDALVMQMTDGRIIRWNNLSDGQRNMLAMVADIAYRCINLNPHLGGNALESAGIVLIDELDVHLHPNWQKKVVKMLKSTFPNIQFIVTTHSPLILHSLDLGDRIINLEDNQAYYVDNMFGRDANDTLLQLMDTKVETPFLKEYFEFVETGKGKTSEALALRQEIENLVGRDYKELAKADALMLFYNKNI